MTAQRYAIVAATVILLAATFFAGRELGYRQGYKVAYTAEHSHYLFERRRSDTMHAAIAKQKGCVNRVAASVTPVQDTGLVAFAETMRAFGLMYWGTVACDRRSGFGYLTQQQIHHIMPGVNSN